MKEHPIIFSTPMVKAILDDRKTQTRRVIKPQPDLGLDPFDSYSRINIGRYHPTMVDKDGQEYPGDEIFGAYTDDGEWGWKCPYGQVGDRLWVRETFLYRTPNSIIYKADGSEKFITGEYIEKFANINDERLLCSPSIFMPRWASRITLEITEIRAERLQDISDGDAIAEGCTDKNPIGNLVLEPRYIFKQLWDSINGKKYPWDSNCWVWVISFKKEEG